MYFHLQSVTAHHFIHTAQWGSSAGYHVKRNKTITSFGRQLHNKVKWGLMCGTSRTFSGRKSLLHFGTASNYQQTSSTFHETFCRMRSRRHVTVCSWEQHHSEEASRSEHSLGNNHKGPAFNNRQCEVCPLDVESKGFTAGPPVFYQWFRRGFLAPQNYFVVEWFRFRDCEEGTVNQDVTCSSCSSGSWSQDQFVGFGVRVLDLEAFSLCLVSVLDRKDSGLLYQDRSTLHEHVKLLKNPAVAVYTLWLLERHGPKVLVGIFLWKCSKFYLSNSIR